MTVKLRNLVALIVLGTVGIADAVLVTSARGAAQRTVVKVVSAAAAAAGSGSVGADYEAQAHLRAAIPAIEAYDMDNGGYYGMTTEKLRVFYDERVPAHVVVEFASDGNYCIDVRDRGISYVKDGPEGDILPGACPDLP